MPLDNVVTTVEIPKWSTSLENPEFQKRVLGLLAQRIRSFLTKRFNQFSKGNGNWKPLKYLRKRNARQAKITKKSTRAAIEKAIAEQTILVDTGGLRNALNPTQTSPGRLEQFNTGSNAFSVTIGIQGGYHPGTPLTIGALAKIHHYGNAKRGLPARPILAPLDATTLAQLRNLLEREIKRVSR